MWDELVEDLSHNYRCVCIDLPGHGENSDINPKESIESMAEKVFALLNFLKIDTATLIGHSMGGYVSCALSTHHPSRVSSLVLVSSHADSDTDEKKQNRTRAEVVIENKYDAFVREAIPGLFHAENLHKHQTTLQTYIKSALSHVPLSMRICSVAMKNRPSYINKLNAINVPVSFICGDQDPIIPLNRLEAQKNVIKNSSIYPISNCGHMPHIEQFKVFRHKINTVLRIQ